MVEFDGNYGGLCREQRCTIISAELSQIPSKSFNSYIEVVSPINWKKGEIMWQHIRGAGDYYVIEDSEPCGDKWRTLIMRSDKREKGLTVKHIPGTVVSRTLVERDPEFGPSTMGHTVEIII